MNPFSFFARKPSTASVAHERLKILLSHERMSDGGDGTLIAQLKEDILIAVGKRINIEADKVRVEMERDNGIAILGIDIELPAKESPLAAGYEPHLKAG
ncbi:MAG: cell division topological specificity factor MinE [Stappiaceae bacterium]